MEDEIRLEIDKVFVAVRSNAPSYLVFSTKEGSEYILSVEHESAGLFSGPSTRIKLVKIK